MASLKRLLSSVVLVVLLAMLARHVFKVIWVLNLHVSSLKHNHAPGPCRYVEGPGTGSEDLQPLSDGLTFVTTGLSWPYLPHKASIRTGIYTFDFKRPNEALKELPIEGEGTKNVVSFHGLSLWQDKTNGEVTLFAIGHRRERDTVELFRFDKKTRKLHHKRTIQSSAFVSINDLIATGPDSFYVTNDGCIRWPTTRDRLFVAEFLLLWNCGSIAYYDGNSARVVGDGYLMANGIQLSSDGKTLYMAHLGEKSIIVFKRNLDNSIEQIRTIDVHQSPDNINIDEETGDLLVVGMYGPFDLSVDPPLASTSVIRIQVNNEDTIDELYSDDGKQLSFGSVALRYENALLIGTVNTKLMFCELGSLQRSHEKTQRRS